MAVYDGTSGDNTYAGTSGADTINGNGGLDRLDGAGGNDTISGGDFNDILHGDAGNDTLRGDAGQDLLWGGLGRDALYGGADRDTFYIDFIDEIVAGEIYDGGEGTDELYLNLVGDVDISGLTLTGIERITAPPVNMLSMTAAQLSGLSSLTCWYLTLTTSGTVIVAPGNIVGASEVYLNAAGNTLSGVGGLIHGSDSADTVTGGFRVFGNGGNDTITGLDASNEIFGGDGNDVLSGGGDQDFIEGNAGNDTIRGDAGDDWLTGGEGDDLMFGGSGRDHFEIFAATEIAAGDSCNGGADFDELVLLMEEGEADISQMALISVEKIRMLYGSNLSMTVAQLNAANVSARVVTLTTAGNVVVSADHEFDISYVNLSDSGNMLDLSGTDRYGISVYGGLAADKVVASTSGSWLNGNGGNDNLTGGLGNDGLNGGDGNDTLNGGGQADYLFGEAGNDIYFVDQGDSVTEEFDQGTDQVRTALANYTLGANVENLLGLSTTGQVLTGNALANAIVGNVGNDTLDGGAGNDVLNGLAGSDAMRGGTGDDLFFVDATGDAVTEDVDAGWDVVRAGVDYVLGANLEELFIGGAARVATGNALANTLHGSGSSNTLSGLAGDDILRGGEGRDVLLGGDGADLLDGGVGKDSLTGGAGRDVFQFRDGNFGTTRALADVITDFSHADKEKIHLGLVDADTTMAGNQSFAFIGNGAFTGVAGQLHYAQAAGNTYVEGDTNGDGTADFVIALTGLHGLVASDFVL